MASILHTYTAEHLTVLEGLEAVRKRPGMYIGSTDQRGSMHCLWEIMDNSVDEALEGYCSRIEVVLNADGSATISDNGRGIPTDTVPGTGLSGVETVYTKLHAGGKFGGASYSSSGGLHGVGASVVNALSERLDVRVFREGKAWQMSFSRGVSGQFEDESRPATPLPSKRKIGEVLPWPQSLSPEAPFVPFTTASQLEIVGKVSSKTTGTSVRFWLDPQIFPVVGAEAFSWSKLVSRARQTAFLVPGLEILCRDERTEQPQELAIKAEGGVVDFVDFLSADAPVTDTWHIQDSATYTEIVQQLGEDGHLRPEEVERICQIDVALRWGTGYDTKIKSFVNIVSTPLGGTHQTGFEAALMKVIRTQIEKNRKSKTLKLTAKDGKVEKEDVLTGLTAVIGVRIPEPQFEGQTKEILGTPQVRTAVANSVAAWLEEKFNSSKQIDKKQTLALLQKIVGEMRSRLSARQQKEISRRKNALENSSLPAKLADCRSHDVAKSELFIVEGDSALGTAKRARAGEFQALLPIRGKILNTQKASTSEMLSNAECTAIIQVVGAGSGKSFTLENCRYGKIIMMTDADVDGAHIRTLLLTLFFRYMRPLIAEGRVYAAVPPLHRIEIIGNGRKKNEIRYTYSEEELHQTLAELKRKGRKYKEPIQRYKGLGEMDANQLSETTMDPQKRVLRQITLEDEDAILEAEKMFELLMGSVARPRRDFIIENAHELNQDRIDA